MQITCPISEKKTMLVQAVANGIIRVRVSEDFKPSIAERYSLIDTKPDQEIDEELNGDTLRAGKLTVTVDREHKRLLMDAGGVTSTVTLYDWEEGSLWQERRQWLVDHLEHWCDRQFQTQFESQDYESSTPPFGAAFTMTEEDRIYGFGEAANEFLKFNGKSVLNRVLYTINEVPLPLAMSTRGWGVFFNTACWHGTDIAAKEKDTMYFFGDHGETDFFLLQGQGLLGITQKYTRLTGAPCVIPKWMYGLSYIANYYARNFDVLQDARDFRREGIPCDMISLEPGWMAQTYDHSTNKDWNDEKFMIRDWMRAPNGDRRYNYAGTFIQALSRYGFKLSLWLCCSYDFTPEEERRAGNPTDFGIEPWFEHLKKFVDDGVDGFKIDPADYTDMSEPNKVYANGMHDPEIHNILQTVLTKQMHLGFWEHTGRRPMHHFCGGYSGTQRWGATTCGDSGGGPKSLGWILNLGITGFPNVTVDMEMHNKERMHYAMFTAWPLLDSWAGFFQPWYAGKEHEQMFREYVELRYRLVPYSYSAGLEAYLTSMPLVRAMPLVYPEIRETEDSVTQYMYGPSMLISALTNRVYLPEGTWLDMWREEELPGGRWLDYDIPENRGGGFFLKAGAIVPMWQVRDFITGEDETEMELLLYPQGKSDYTLYEDDGITNAYRENQIASTYLEMEHDGAEVRFCIHPREGSFDGMKDQRSWHVTVLRQSQKLQEVLVNGQAVEFGYENGKVTFAMGGSTNASYEAVIR